MTVRILTGDCREVLRSLDAESVQACITSPPYWGLRDYKIAPSIWGGDPDCRHDFADERRVLELRRGSGLAVLGARMKGGGGLKASEVQTTTIERGFCVHCSAWRGCYGLEPSYQLYVQHTVEIFREVYRVLRRDGTLWLNMGDCYACNRAGWSAERYKAENSDDRAHRDKPFNTFIRGKGSKHDRTGKARVGSNRAQRGDGNDGIAYGPMEQPNREPQVGLKQKDLAGIPWRVAFALQDDGWYLRRDIVWHKRNPMPESVYDRPTTAHEFLFLFSKSGDTQLWRHLDGRWTDERPAPDYFWRHRRTRLETTADMSADPEWFRVNRWRGFDYYYDFAAIMEPSSPDSHARAARSRSNGHKYADGGPGGQTIAINAPVAGRVPHKTVGANSRINVDRLPQSRKSAAAFDGPRPKSNVNFDLHLGSADLVPMRNKRSVWSIATKPFKEAHFATFPPALIEPCILAGAPAGGLILDPFGGAGTTGLVADRLGRSSVLIEINEKYAAMAEARIARERMGPEEKRRHAVKASGALKPPQALPLFRVKRRSRRVPPSDPASAR